MTYSTKYSLQHETKQLYKQNVRINGEVKKLIMIQCFSKNQFELIAIIRMQINKEQGFKNLCKKNIFKKDPFVVDNYLKWTN